MEQVSQGLQTLSIQFLPFMVAVVFHEFAHGFAAAHWGDNTAKDSGRLTLNPTPHIDPIGTLLFPVVIMLTGMNFLIGWAKPVPINPSRFRKYRPGLFWVSFAGPLMNFALSFLSAAAFVLMIKFLPRDFFAFEPILAMTQVSIYLNLALGIFNLLPLPPLDGSKMIQSFLSYHATQKYESIAQYSFFILMALMFTGALSVVFYPIRIVAGLFLGFWSWLFGMGAVL